MHQQHCVHIISRERLDKLLFSAFLVFSNFFHDKALNVINYGVKSQNDLTVSYIFVEQMHTYIP